MLDSRETLSTLHMEQFHVLPCATPPFSNVCILAAPKCANVCIYLMCLDCITVCNPRFVLTVFDRFFYKIVYTAIRKRKCYVMELCTI